MGWACMLWLSEKQLVSDGGVRWIFVQEIAVDSVVGVEGAVLSHKDHQPRWWRQACLNTRVRVKRCAS